MVDVMQFFHSSLYKLEDQNCSSGPGNVLTVKTTYYNFGAAIWSNQLMGTPRTGHLVDGLEMDRCFVIFTMICFQKYFIELCITFLNVLEALAQE